MKRTHLLAVLVVSAAATVLVADASAMYHPGMGRFMQRDPIADLDRDLIVASPSADAFVPQGPEGADPAIAYSDGMNLYEYVRSSPTGYVDPLGLLATQPGDPTSAPATSTCPADKDCEGEQQCCKCLVFQEGTGGCEAAVYWVMKNRQKTKWPDFKDETGFCAQTKKPKTFTGAKATRYKNCCNDRFAPNDSPDKAAAICSGTGAGTDPTGGAQYFANVDQPWWAEQIKKGNCRKVAVPGCKLKFLKCKNRPVK
jgi:hypothetical protein